MKKKNRYPRTLNSAGTTSAYRDRTTSACVQDVRCVSTNSVLFVAEKANHSIHSDEPEVVVDAIRDVVARVRSREALRAGSDIYQRPLRARGLRLNSA